MGGATPPITDFLFTTFRLRPQQQLPRVQAVSPQPCCHAVSPSPAVSEPRSFSGLDSSSPPRLDLLLPASFLMKMWSEDKEFAATSPLAPVASMSPAHLTTAQSGTSSEQLPGMSDCVFSSPVSSRTGRTEVETHFPCDLDLRVTRHHVPSAGGSTESIQLRQLYAQENQSSTYSHQLEV